MPGMLRPVLRSSAARSSAFAAPANGMASIRASSAAAARISHRARMFATQSGDDAKPATALAKLHLEDGSTFIGKSFGCHESVEGEVRAFLLVIRAVSSRNISKVDSIPSSSRQAETQCRALLWCFVPREQMQISKQSFLIYDDVSTPSTNECQSNC